MPVLRPALDFFLLVAITFLHDPEKFIVITFCFDEIVIGQLAPFLFDFTFELLPTSFELVSIHDSTSLPSVPEWFPYLYGINITSVFPRRSVYRVEFRTRDRVCRD